MSQVRVRPAEPADYPAVARLTVDAYAADGQLNEASASYASTLADVAARADAGTLLVAVEGAGILGSVLYVEPGSQYAELSRPGEAEFRMLAVDPAAQGRGAGRALVQACVDRATAAGCTAVVICVRDFAVAAQKLYQALGFARVPDLDWSPLPGVDLLALRLDIHHDHGGLV
jgi:ribosomal protein S18 acetylase RimI-like enzyme